MQRATAHPVHHFNTERGKRTLVVRFFHEQAESLPQERVETFLCGEVRIVAYAFEFVPVIAPCHDIAVATHRDKPLAVSFVQVLVYPLLVHLVGTGVAGERLHIPGGLLEVLQVFGVVVYEDELIIDVVTRQ